MAALAEFEVENETTPEAAHGRAVAVFVSTALDTWATDQPEVFARDVQINDTAYRRLDPEYFAWLRAKMMAARNAAQAGQLPIDAFNTLRSRFNAVQTWAMEHFGEPPLREAVRVLDVRRYAPPMAVPAANVPARGLACPAVSGRSSPTDVSPDAIAHVNEIRDDALALGWNHDRLYGVPATNRFSLAANSGLAASSGLAVSAALAVTGGLASYLREGWRTGDVTRESIETIGPPPHSVRQRFYNPDVDQPWIIRLNREKNVTPHPDISRKADVYSNRDGNSNGSVR